MEALSLDEKLPFGHELRDVNNREDDFPAPLHEEEEESIEEGGQRKQCYQRSSVSPPPPPPALQQPQQQQQQQQQYQHRLLSSQDRPMAGEDDEVLLLLEEREMLREQLRAERTAREELQRQHQKGVERLIELEVAIGETTRMYQHAKIVALQCSEDASEAMVELRKSQALRQKLHTSLDTAVDQLQRLHGGMQAEPGLLLEGHGQFHDQRDSQQQQQQQARPLDEASSYSVADAQRRASVVIHMLEILHGRCAATVSLRRQFVLRCFFELWRYQVLNDEGRQANIGMGEALGAAGEEGVLVAEKESARHMIDTCMSLVDDILQHPEVPHQQHTHSFLHSISSLRHGESPAPSFASEASLQAVLGRDRLLRREVAGLQGKVQAQQDVQSVLFDILATYEAKLCDEEGLDLSLSDAGDDREAKWWEASGESRGEERGEGEEEDMFTVLSGTGGGSSIYGPRGDRRGRRRIGGGRGGGEGGGGGGGERGGGGGGKGGGGKAEGGGGIGGDKEGEGARGTEGGGGSAGGGGAHLIRRLERFCRSVQKALEERMALTGQLERSLADCVCSQYNSEFGQI